MLTQKSVFVTLVLFCFCSITSVAAPIQETQSAFGAPAPEKCVFYSSWAGLPQLNASGNATEQWLAQDGIQLMFQKLTNACEKYLESNPASDPAVNNILALGTDLLDHSATFYIDSIIDEQPQGGFLIDLGEHKQLALDSLQTWLEKSNQQGNDEFTKQEIGGKEIYVLDGPQETKVAIAIDGSLLRGMFGNQAIELLTADNRLTEPSWMKNLTADPLVSRPLLVMRIDSEIVVEEINKTEADVPEFLKLEEFKSMEFVFGMDNSGMATHGTIHCPKQLQGLLGVADVKGFGTDEFAEIPEGVLSGGAMRVSIAKIWELVQLGFEEGENREELDANISQFEEMTGLDIERDLIGQFDDFGITYQQLNLTNPMGGLFLALRIKDAAAFAPVLKKINSSVDDYVGGMGMQFSEKENNGNTFFSVEQPGFGAFNVSWCQVDNWLYLAQDQKAITTHLRKRKRDSGRLIDDEWLQSMIKANETGNLKDPIIFSYVDSATLLQTAIPALQLVFSQMDIEAEFDFTFDDIPGVEVLSKGVKPNLTFAYRTERGLEIIERSTLPITGITTSGVAIGMLLPAVQQVRAAARRSVSQNNLRQLVLSLLNYESANMQFPPAYSKDENDKPLLSWRVYILPYLEETALFEQFQLDEPWDSEHNRPLADKMPPFFQNPSVPLKSGMTTYLGISGQDGVLAVPQEAIENDGRKAGKGTNFGQVTDGTSNTILVIEVNKENAVIWTKPDDVVPDNVMDFDSLLKGNYPGRSFNAAMTDGSCHFFSLEKFTKEDLLSLMKKSDGNIVDF